MDGDVYMCIWDLTLVEGFKEKAQVHPPAVYKKFREEGASDSNDIVDHMASYFEKDNLGHLANLHLALCD